MDASIPHGKMKRQSQASGAHASPNAALAAAVSGPLLVLITFTVPITTLTGTAAGLSAGPGAQAWILSGMSVGAGAGVLGSGAIGDDFGRRRTFLYRLHIRLI
jgi:MFS family permease